MAAESLSPQGRRTLAASLDLELDAIAKARLPELRVIWSSRLGEDPPALRSREIFRRMLAYRVQAAALGGLSGAARRKLDDIEQRRASRVSKPAPPLVRLSPGLILIRKWKGVRHEARVVDRGFLHEGKTYRSLSEVARAITGTRWNGPLFFGLRDQPKAAA